MKIYTKIIRFIVSGIFAATTEYLVFLLLVNINWFLILANTVSFLSGLIVSFTLNKQWVFSVGGNAQKQFISYLGLALFNLFVSNFLIIVLVNKLSLQELIAKLAVMVCIAIWNYLFYSQFIFKKNN